MENKSVGESRKKGIATGAITAIVAYHPKTWMEISVSVIVAVIAIYAIYRQANLDKENKDVEKNNTNPDDLNS